MLESCEVSWHGSTWGGWLGAALPGPAEPEAPELSGAPKAGGAGEETETCGLVFGCVMVAGVLRGQVTRSERVSRSRNGVSGSHRLMRAVHWEVRRVVHGSRHHRHGDHRDHLRESNGPQPVGPGGPQPGSRCFWGTYRLSDGHQHVPAVRPLSQSGLDDAQAGRSSPGPGFPQGGVKVWRWRRPCR